MKCKLYEIPKESIIYCEIILKDSLKKKLIPVTFHNIDGMYSYCTLENGEVVHLSANTPLVSYEDGFKISN